MDLNVTAIRAGYSEKTANVIGPENLIKPYIAEAIQKELDKRFKRVEITRNRVLAEYARLGFLDPRKFYDDELLGYRKFPDVGNRNIAIGWWSLK